MVIQFCSVSWSCLTFCGSMNSSTQGSPAHHQLLQSTETHVYHVGDAIQPSRFLLSPSPPTFNLSQQQGLLQWVSSLHQVVTVLEFQLQRQSFQWVFRTDFLVQGTLKSLFQHHNSKVSILQWSAFFRVQLSHPYMSTGKNIDLTRWIFVGKVMSLLFNILSRLVIAFLLRSKCLLTLWLQSPSAVILVVRVGL